MKDYNMQFAAAGSVAIVGVAATVFFAAITFYTVGIVATTVSITLALAAAAATALVIVDAAAEYKFIRRYNQGSAQ